LIKAILAEDHAATRALDGSICHLETNYAIKSTCTHFSKLKYFVEK
jgi:hypothetical protein